MRIVTIAYCLPLTTPLTCHSERSEESVVNNLRNDSTSIYSGNDSLKNYSKILRCAQDDKQPELLCAIHGNELGVVVKRKAENIYAKITVGSGEKQVLMPYMVDDL